MGQQLYESHLERALRSLDGNAWTVTTSNVIPFRAKSAVNSCRIPVSLVWQAPYTAAAAIGTRLYGRVDLVHRLDLRCPPSAGREVVTIHDLPPLRFDDEGKLPRWAAHSARAAAAVICPTEFAASEVRELLGVKRVHVVPYGIDSGRASVEIMSDAELDGLGINRPFVLHAAGATQRKNLRLLADAWRQVAPTHPDAALVLCGPPSRQRTLLMENLPRTHYLGHRTPDFMARLIRTAAVIAVPSTYEGFGLPLLEGMLAGTTVVGVACGALPEVAADGAILVSPDEESFAAALSHALSGGPELEKVRAAGRTRAAEFTWEHAAQATAAVYEDVLA